MIHLQPALLSQLRQAVPSKASVCVALQQAIELEHATIPLYLYSLYSLDPEKNGAIVDIIQSVVVEEMLHMTLVSNIINALGSTPIIDKPGFIPTYPGPLPGGVESELTVHLAPFSMKQLETFLAVEQPADPLVFRSLAVGAAPQPVTIGEFYDEIGRQIVLLGDSAFTGPIGNQIGPNQMRYSVVVTDVKTAVAAIHTIVTQGEGTKTTPEELEGSGYAHYYRFMEIKKGRRLVKQPGALPPTQQYTYSGAPIPFDTTGVYAAPTDPKSSNYPAGSAQAFACNTFNYTYTALLRSLERMLTGKPSDLGTAIGLMMSLKGQAKDMMSGIPNPATITGPSFEYQPINP